MNLRTRIFATSALVALPVIVGYTALDAWARRDLSTGFLENVGRARLSGPGAREACESDPTAFAGFLAPPHGPPGGRGQGHGPPDEPPGPRGFPPPLPPRMWTYDEAFRATGADAPPFPTASAGAAWTAAPSGSRRTVWVVGPTGWGGPCAWVLVEGRPPPGFLGAFFPPAYVWLTPTLLVVAIALVAVDPSVRRIRALTERVRAAAPDDLSGLRDALSAGPLARDEVVELAAAFDEAGARVRAEIVAKDARERSLREFLANTTHDVMIPLTVLLGHLTELRRRGAEAELVGRALDEAHYLGALFANLSAASRLEGQTPRRDPVDLLGLVDRVVARHAGLAGQRGVELVVALPGEPLSLPGDVTLLEQAVGNLVYNAIRYNRAGGHVAVTLDREGPDLVLRVLDDGPGLSDEALARLGQRGFRTDEARSRAPDGRGLGLDIARRVAEVHGLDLGFARSEYGGLEVTLRGPGQGGT